MRSALSIPALALSAAFAFAFAGAAAADDDACPHHGPPPEALAACNGKAGGDACSVTFKDNTTHEGTCYAPEGKPLACRPNDMPSPPPR